MAIQPVVIDNHEITIQPVFRHESIEDINASEREGVLVKKVRTVVEVRFAGTDRYQPVFPVDAFWQYQNGRAITYAERWADQYNQFLTGADQRAAGTPLEMLRPYGISDSQLSLCRALKIYSIESLNAVEGDAAQGLQMARNALKKMAKDYLDAKAMRGAGVEQVADLQKQIEELRLQLAKASDGKSDTVVTEVVPDQDELAAITEAANAEIAAMTADQIKDEIAQLTGSRPRGKPSHDTLVSMLTDLRSEVA